VGKPIEIVLNAQLFHIRTQNWKINRKLNSEDAMKASDGETIINLPH
jgi:hypothetical protein